MNPELLLIPILIFGGLFGYPVLQVWASARMKGMWRILSFLPLLVMGPVLFVTIKDLCHGSNLWPIFLILSTPFAVVYLGLLLFVHKAARPNGA